MKKVKCLILLFVVIYYPINAQSFLHFGLGAGRYGGATAHPYKNPFIPYDGFTATMEIERVLFNNNSYSVQLSYSKYNKAELFTDEAISEAFYITTFYNMSTKSEAKNLFFEISPLLAVGFESINWRDDITGIFSSHSDLISGIDKMTYLLVGFRGTVGFQINGNPIKFSITPKYDFVIDKERDVVINTLSGERAIEIENPNFYSRFYAQLNISIGIKL